MDVTKPVIKFPSRPLHRSAVRPGASACRCRGDSDLDLAAEPPGPVSRRAPESTGGSQLPDPAFKPQSPGLSSLPFRAV